MTILRNGLHALTWFALLGPCALAQVANETDVLKPSISWNILLTSFDAFGDDVAVGGPPGLAIGDSGDPTNGANSATAYLFDLATGGEIAKLLASAVPVRKARHRHRSPKPA